MEDVKCRMCSKRTYWLESLNYYMSPILLLIADYFAIIAAVITAKYLRDYMAVLFGLNTQLIYIKEVYSYVIFPAIFLAFIAFSGLYSKRMPFWQSAEAIFRLCVYVNVVVILMMYLGGVAGSVSRLFMVLLSFLSFFYLCICRFLSKNALLKIGLWQRPVVIIGAGKTAVLIANAFAKEPGIGYRIVGLIEDKYESSPLKREYPHLGTFQTMETAIIYSKVRDVIIATPGLEREALLALVQRVQPLTRNLTIVPDLFGIPVANIETERFIDDRLVLLKTRNNLESPINRAIKRMFDIVVGYVLFVLLIPFLLIFAIVICRDSPGPAIHVANRIGKNGKEFSCYKFRSMYMDSNQILQEYLLENPAAAEEWKRFAKLRQYDPRVTKVGKWLRRYSLDELPQIFNVVLGNMSLVGPRPYLPREKKAMGYYLQTIALTVPGITGLWQVSGRNEIEFAERLKLDAWYVRNWSVWQDIVLLIKTVNVVVNKKGAY